MEQCSHQTLKSGFELSVFATCRNPVGFVDIGRRLLESKNNGICVIGFVLAVFDGTRQHERSCGSLCALNAVAVIDSK
jgi:hypothetical protein